MLSNRLAFAALALACIGAAAGGGYLASRQMNAPAAARTVDAVTEPAPSAEAPVEETEAIVNDAARPPATTATPPAKPPSSRPASKRGPAVRPEAPAAANVLASRPAPTGAKVVEPLPTLDRTWTVGAAGNPSQASPGGAPLPTPVPPVEAPPAAVPRVEERTVQDAPRAPEPPQKAFEELLVPADSVIGLQAETSVTSDRARIEDRVEARVTRDVRVHDTVAIPAGSRALGSVVSVERGGKFKERARLGIRFNMLVLADGSRVPISTETIYRDGEAPGRGSAAKIGGATVGGAILGAIFGGGKGAAIGATAGAGAGSATVMASDRNGASLHSGEPITVRILSPVSVTIEQK
jgi:hypothetical protein